MILENSLREMLFLKLLKFNLENSKVSYCKGYLLSLDLYFLNYLKRLSKKSTSRFDRFCSVLMLLKMGCLRKTTGHFFSRSQSVWKYFFLKKHILNPLKKNLQVDWTRLSNFGEVQKVRFLSIFSNARNKSIFFRMFIKT